MSGESLGVNFRPGRTNIHDRRYIPSLGTENIIYGVSLTLTTNCVSFDLLTYTVYMVKHLGHG